MADEETGLSLAAVVQEAARQPCRVGTHDHLVVSWIQRQLVESLVQHDEVVLHCVRRRVARTEKPGERLTGGIEIGDEGMKAIAVLVGGGTTSTLTDDSIASTVICDLDFRVAVAPSTPARADRGSRALAHG
jgi:hypothetical protein